MPRQGVSQKLNIPSSPDSLLNILAIYEYPMSHNLQIFWKSPTETCNLGFPSNKFILSKHEVIGVRIIADTENRNIKIVEYCLIEYKVAQYSHCRILSLREPYWCRS